MRGTITGRADARGLKLGRAMYEFFQALTSKVFMIGNAGTAGSTFAEAAMRLNDCGLQS